IGVKIADPNMAVVQFVMKKILIKMGGVNLVNGQNLNQKTPKQDYVRIVDIGVKKTKYVDRGAFGIIYKAIWTAGTIYDWDHKKNEWLRIKQFINIDNDEWNYIQASDYDNEKLFKSKLDELKDKNTLYSGGGCLVALKEFPSDEAFLDETFLKEDKKIYGVLPYVAPEVLKSKDYTKAADIYSIGGDRPNINNNIPLCYSTLITRCWNEDRDLRPTAEELYRTFSNWSDFYEAKNLDQTFISDDIRQAIRQFQKADEIQSPNENMEQDHSEANFKSQSLETYIYQYKEYIKSEIEKNKVVIETNKQEDYRHNS
ncbi:15277_t:CDS:2, partial [Racocetra fulgida]